MKGKLALYIGVATAVISLWLVLIFLPLERERNDAIRKITETDSQLADIDRTLEKLPAFLEESRSLEASRKQLQSSLYAKEDILRLLRQISDRAAARRLSITEIIPPVEELLLLNQTVPNPNEPQFLNITLRIEGDYVDFGKLVNELEQAPFFRGINICRVNGSRDLSRDAIFSLGFRALLGNVEAAL